MCLSVCVRSQYVASCLLEIFWKDNYFSRIVFSSAKLHLKSLNASYFNVTTYHLISVKYYDAQKLELDHARFTLTLEQRKVGEIEMKLDVKDNLFMSLTEEKNLLRTQLSRVEEERRTEGRNFENMIAERIVKVREEDLRSKEFSLAELRETSWKEQLALEEKILLLEKTLLLVERDAGVIKLYVQHCLHYPTCFWTTLLVNHLLKSTTTSLLHQLLSLVIYRTILLPVGMHRTVYYLNKLIV